MNERNAQILTAALGVLLVVVVGATVLILLTRPAPPAGPTPSPSGTALASGTPSFTPSPLLTTSPSPSFSPTPTASLLPTLAPTDSPSPSPSASPSSSPSASPSPTPTASPSASPSPSPTAAPTVAPDAPARQFTLRGLGVDSRALGEQRIERVIIFTVDGQSNVTAEITNSSAAGFRLCLYEENELLVTADDCSTSANASLTKPWTESGQSRWYVTIIGTETNVSPFVDLQVSYNANSGDVELNNFRLSGTFNPQYNGFTIDLATVDPGSLDVQADFDSQITYDLVIDEVGGGNVRNDSGAGPANSVSTSDQVGGGSTYRVSIGSPDDNGAAGFVHAEISWP